MRVAVLASGRGSNLLALLEAAAADALGSAQLVGLVVNRPGAGALDHAARHDLPSCVVDHRAYPTRRDFEGAMIEAMAPWAADLIVLAGFMRVLTPHFLDDCGAPVINLHPALLPAFPGASAIDEAFDAAVPISGCTTHVVVPEVDAGPVLMQGVVPRKAADRLADFAARMHAMEHRILPATVRALARGQLVIHAGAVRCDPAFEAGVLP